MNSKCTSCSNVASYTAKLFLLVLLFVLAFLYCGLSSTSAPKTLPALRGTGLLYDHFAQGVPSDAPYSDRSNREQGRHNEEGPSSPCSALSLEGEMHAKLGRRPRAQLALVRMVVSCTTKGIAAWRSPLFQRLAHSCHPKVRILWGLLQVHLLHLMRGKALLCDAKPPSAASHRLLI